MKTVTMQQRRSGTRTNIPYPNAATKKEMLHKILDTLLSAVSGAALAAIVLFLLAVA